ncbi:RND family transporter [Mycobacteroides abscessus]|uniref:MMPL/RND family transporter n=1 Tax=Mycobacteroides abscessus TaxID=36809 RepID=UPI000C255D07|nr:RND family transporter [Mycobacteroides abscessus]PVB24106.1 RND family transporter [Mycobacteroides abscessus]
MGNKHVGRDRGERRPFVAHAVRVLAIPIVLFWVGVAVLLSVLVPKLDGVTKQHAGPMVPLDAPSQRAMLHIGEKFQESTSTSLAYILLETEGRILGDADHKYYDELIRLLDADKQHVQFIMNMWGKPITAAGSQSPDNKAAYVMLRLVGDIGEAAANESTIALRKTVQDTLQRTPPPPGLRVYVSGAAPLSADLLDAGDKSMKRVLLFTIAVIIIMLVLVYRSIACVVLILLTVAFEFTVSNGIVSFFVVHNIIGISTFATSMVESLIIAAGTDYGIFLLGRYHEARNAGEDRDRAFYTTFHGVSHVILGSGLTIAGACLCLGFARLGYFNTMGPACAIAMLVTVAAALTLGPALLAIASKFGLLDPKQAGQSRGWRRVGTIVVRWPKPVLVASSAAVLVGAVFLPSYRVSYNERAFQPVNTPANAGFMASDRHFAGGKLNSEMLLIESDHDMRNPADFISLDHVAKTIFHTPGIAQVQGITRPEGRPMERASIANILAGQGSSSGQQLPFTENQVADLDNQVAVMDHTISIMQTVIGLMDQMTQLTHEMVGTMEEMKALADQVEVNISAVDDFLRPIKNYYYWEPHCADIPICWMGRSMFESMDSIDGMTALTAEALASMQVMDQLLPRMLAQTRMALSDMTIMRGMMVKSRGTQALNTYTAADDANDMIDIGQDFDDSRNDDLFYAPKYIFSNTDFQVALRFLVSPDGTAARFIINHDGEALSPEGVAHVNAIEKAAYEFSFSGAFGLGILIWQHIIGLNLHWMVLPLTFILLVAVGSDYNLLLIARMKEELQGGIQTGIIRSVGSTGGVVTAAGLVFAFTMLSMVPNDLRAISQVGSIICVGLLLDTLIVRSFIVPAIARILGPWFWWPRVVRWRPAHASGAVLTSAPKGT